MNTLTKTNVTAQLLSLPHAGLPNVGNSCYASTLAHLLTATPDLITRWRNVRGKITVDQCETDRRRKLMPRVKMTGHPIAAALLEALDGSRSTAMHWRATLVGVFSSIADMLGESDCVVRTSTASSMSSSVPLSVQGQEDVDEAIGVLVNVLPSEMVDLFRFTHANVTRCGNCDYAHTSDPVIDHRRHLFLSSSLNGNGTTTVQALIDENQSWNLCHGAICERYSLKHLQAVTKRAG